MVRNDHAVEVAGWWILAMRREALRHTFVA
jgi:hypothetical protein